ncbi:hypothetical protein [Ancylobacter sp. TS-1]|uniref:hypothetical protein n=1 Tax=Ancylobacter sp. TS-1 TaxID=1850374 RepID=UPI001265AB89|nr:hypothetical protein [Ancylobacter sp. TS-1]QFR33582.1 hypothetical protein GBB76_10880 [Ancylobacter sp. TS-1]
MRKLDCQSFAYACAWGLANAAFLAATPASADSKTFLYEFMKSVGCSQVPAYGCDLLDVDNARSIALTYRGLLSSHYCGTINVAQARQLSQIGMASPECDLIIQQLYDDTQRWNQPTGATAPASAPAPGGVSVHVAPQGRESNLDDVSAAVNALR